MNVTTRDTLTLPKRKSLKLKLQSEAPLLPLFQQFLLNEFTHARQHEKGIIRDDNLEFVHQYRVSLRRIRSLLKQLKHLCPTDAYSALIPQLKIMMIHTNQLRDLDVYLLKMDDYFNYLEHIHHQGLARFFDDLQDARKSSFKAVKRWLKSDDYQQQAAHIEAVLNQNWGQQKTKELAQQKKQRENASQRQCLDAAQKVIKKTTQAVKQHSVLLVSDKNGDRNRDDCQIHQLRIACKQLRYNLEFFAPLINRERLKEQLTLLKSLQTTLGDFNDASVQQQFLLSYRSNKKPSSHRYRAISSLIDITERQHCQSRKRILKQLPHFHQALLKQHDALFR
ncbi:CHAD domain-containing protein [Photobacterium kagoshimensis]|uniref:CHAD domain-containing protein n=1 Tax=Photobacterium kagoshimensis TaxID=2910242 RepID=UPI003D107D65